MKNLSLILNVVLLIAVVVLYILHFRDKSPKAAAAKPGNDSLTANQIIRTQIAYVNSDTLLNQYDYFKTTRDELESKRKKIEGEINSRARALQNEIVAYQQKGKNMTLEQVQLTEQNLMRKEQELMRYREEVSQQLAEEEQKKNEELYQNIAQYLQKYAKDKPYKFIFGYTKGGGILYANDSLEITRDVLQGLNEEHKGGQKP